MEGAMSDQDRPADPYALVIADLQGKREKIDQTIALLESLRGMSVGIIGLGGAGSLVTDAVGRVLERGPEDRDGAFLGLTIVDAAKAVLAARKKAQSTTAITEAIMRGGVVLASAVPANTVGSVLNRQAKNAGDIVSVARGMWGLAAWYPNPSRFAKRRDSDKGDGEANGTKADGAAIAPSSTPAAPTFNIPPAPPLPPKSVPVGDDLDDEIPF